MPRDQFEPADPDCDEQFVEERAMLFSKEDGTELTVQLDSEREVL